MPKISLDLSGVADTLDKKRFKFSEVSHKFEKVAFDVYRLKTASDMSELWQIQNNDDGDYIVAVYNDEDEMVEKVAKTASLNSPWSVVSKNADLHIFYKNDHCVKLAASSLGFGEADTSLVVRYLPQKLAENKDLVKALMKGIDKGTLEQLLVKYPELK